MTKCQHKNKINNCQDDISPLGPATLAQKAKNIPTELRTRNYLKTTFMNMIEVLKGKINKSVKEIQENKQCKAFFLT